MIPTDAKRTGATFTPAPLADFLADRLLPLLDPCGVVSVLDPACGDGELLVSFARKLRQRDMVFSLTGFDANDEFLRVARARTQTLGAAKLDLIHADFLKNTYPPQPQGSLNFGWDAPTHIKPGQVDVIIANPPYVRTQTLGSQEARRLAVAFGLTGRVDLYHVFLVAMTNCLREGGILGVITSNRYLSTKGGESIRKFLADNYEILEVIDLGDTKLFDAAVLPALLIARKKQPRPAVSLARFIKLYEALTGYAGSVQQADSIYEVLLADTTGYFEVAGKRYKKTEGRLSIGAVKTNRWALLSDEEARWTATIEAAAAHRIGDLVKVKVGIKTTADSVFIRDDWAGMGANIPEAGLLRPLLSQETIRPWRADDDPNLRVLYPHHAPAGKKQPVDLAQYPKALAYLSQHQARLRARNYLIDAGRAWFEIWVAHHPTGWALPKVVFPDISASPRFCFDTTGKVVNGNCYWMSARTAAEVRILLLIQGIANSRLMTRYHDVTFNNKLYAGRRRYLTQYVERYPLPAPDSEAAQQIIDIVIQLNGCTDARSIGILEYKLEEIVANAFGVPPVHTL